VLVALITIHVIAAAVLILFILLHAGRGGGLSEMFGGGMTGGGSTVVEKNLDRLTVIMAVVFTATTIALYFKFK
jgi:preprotein translocase subunit SecG